MTAWTYDAGRGLLETKTYADDSAVTYTYTPDGKLATRTWARGADGVNLTGDISRRPE